MTNKLMPESPSHRQVLKAGAAALAALHTPLAFAGPLHTRKNLQGRNVTRDLQNYKKAVAAMLKLPPTDPRNWYRNALTHMFDCPHGNWWFLVWHRAYLGWFEQTCRTLCGDPTFALPFWDWTAAPEVPGEFWNDVLDPSNSGFVSDGNTFDGAFRQPVRTYWDRLSPAQRRQMDARGYGDFEAFWDGRFGVLSSFPRGGARDLTAAAPQLGPRAAAAVREQVLRDLLAPRDFVSRPGGTAFESRRTPNHHSSRDQSVLEGQPHNLVHASISGFMGDFLSPVDPIFFLHHCNIDRLWDVWTRKQQAMGRPTGPSGEAWTAFSREAFLFFHDSAGGPARKKTAGDYFSVGNFGYDYEPGTGSDTVDRASPVAAAPVAVSTSASGTLGIRRAATVALRLPEAIARPPLAATPPRIFARVTIAPPRVAGDVTYDVFVGPRGAPVDLQPDGPNYAGSFAFFGHDHHASMPATFTIGITEAVNRLRAQGALTEAQPVDVSVVADAQLGLARSTAAGTEGRLQSVSIGTF